MATTTVLAIRSETSHIQVRYKKLLLPWKNVDISIMISAFINGHIQMILPGYKVAPTSSSSLLPAISIWPYCNMDESYFVLACEFHQVFCTHSSSAAVYTVLYKRNGDCEAFCVRRYHTMPATRTALNRGLYKCMLLCHTTNNSQEKFDLKVFLAATLHLPLHRIRMSPRSVSIASAD